MMNEYSELSHYHSFMEYFGDKITFQTFDDKVKNKKLIKQLHGSLQKHFKTLTRLNKQGAGIFFCVNETDLEGRSTKNIKNIRAVFIDLDGTPLDFVGALPLDGGDLGALGPFCSDFSFFSPSKN